MDINNLISLLIGENKNDKKKLLENIENLKNFRIIDKELFNMEVGTFFSNFNSMFKESKKLQNSLHGEEKLTDFEKVVDKFYYFMEYYLPSSGLKNDQVYVSESKIHSRGLFAKKDIEKGNIITFYPADFICDERIRKFISVTGNDISYDQIKDYRMGNGEFSMYGYPENIKNELLLGHMVNDSMKIDIEDIDENNITELDIKNLRNRVGKYILGSKNNAMIQDELLKLEVDDMDSEEKVAKYFLKSNQFRKNLGIHYVIATKNIKKGEEILISYGIDFWLKRPNISVAFQNSMDNNYYKFLRKNVRKLV